MSHELDVILVHTVLDPHRHGVHKQLPHPSIVVNVQIQNTT